MKKDFIVKWILLIAWNSEKTMEREDFMGL